MELQPQLCLPNPGGLEGGMTGRASSLAKYKGLTPGGKDGEGFISYPGRLQWRLTDTLGSSERHQSSSNG